MEKAEDMQMETDDIAGGGEQAGGQAGRGEGQEEICDGHQAMKTEDGMRCVRCNARLEWDNQLDSEKTARETETTGGPELAFDQHDYNELGVQAGSTNVSALALLSRPLYSRYSRLSTHSPHTLALSALCVALCRQEDEPEDGEYPREDAARARGHQSAVAPRHEGEGPEKVDYAHKCATHRRSLVLSIDTCTRTVVHSAHSEKHMRAQTRNRAGRATEQ